MWQLREAGWFCNVKGFLIGRTQANKEIEDFTYLDAIRNAIYDLGVPIIYDIDVGHVPPQLTLVNGSYATVSYTTNSTKITQKCI